MQRLTQTVGCFLSVDYYNKSHTEMQLVSQI